MSCIDHVEAGGARAPRVLRQQNRLRQECTVGTGRSMQESTLAEYRKQQQQIQSGFQILDFGCACWWISNVVLISDGGQGDQVPRTMRCDALLLRRTRAFRDSPTKSSLGGQVGRERKVYRRCALERPFKPQVVRWQSAVATDFQTSSPADLKNPTACPDIAALDSICIAMYGQSGSKGKGWAPETACREHRRCQVLEGKGDRFGGACRGQRGSCNGTTVCGRQAMVEVQQIETIATGGQHSETETQLVRARARREVRNGVLRTDCRTGSSGQVTDEELWRASGILLSLTSVRRAPRASKRPSWKGRQAKSERCRPAALQTVACVACRGHPDAPHAPHAGRGGGGGGGGGGAGAAPPRGAGLVRTWTSS